MPVRNSHIILRQVFDLYLPPGVDIFATQQDVGTLVRGKLMPAMEDLFDRFASSEELIQIDKLEIDIGNFQGMPSDDEFVEAVINGLEEKLLSYIRYSVGELKRTPIGTKHFAHWLFFLEKGHLPWNETIGEEVEFHQAVLEQFSEDTHVFSQLQQLLRNYPDALSRLINQHPESFLVKLLAVITTQPQHKLPGYRLEVWQLFKKVATSQKRKDVSFDKQTFYQTFWKQIFHQAFFQQSIKKETDSLVLGFLQYWLDKQNKAFERRENSLLHVLVDSLKAGAASFPFLFNILERIESPSFSQSLPVISPDSEIDKTRKDTKNQEEQQLLIAKQKQGQDEKQKEQDLKIKEKQKLPPNYSKEIIVSEEKSDETENIGDSSTSIKKEDVEGEHTRDDKSITPNDLSQPKTDDDSQEISLRKEELDKGRAESLEDEYNSTKDQEKLEKLPAVQESKISSQKFKEDEYPEGSALYIHHAGVVLLHTFFPVYFNKCKLLKDGEFVSDSARHKAVHLLQYLASGETGLPEYELVLPKFLCGVPFEVPIARDIKITKKEKKETTELLQAAINHWGKLGKSSPDGLREGFLQREGKLEKRQQGWYLTVEQKSIDVLLDHLPWNLRMVKLPWMPDLLRVEWG